jgi:hypothetical protein
MRRLRFTLGSSGSTTRQSLSSSIGFDMDSLLEKDSTPVKKYPSIHKCTTPIWPALLHFEMRSKERSKYFGDNRGRRRAIARLLWFPICLLTGVLCASIACFGLLFAIGGPDEIVRAWNNQTGEVVPSIWQFSMAFIFGLSMGLFLGGILWKALMLRTQFLTRREIEEVREQVNC